VAREVSPITATFDQAAQTTTYSVVASNPAGRTLTLTWSGPNCGTTTEPTNRSFAWRHPHVPGDPLSCAQTTDHSDVTITLRVSDSVSTVTCTYQGTLTGTGPACR
jgi:hypothetical protein